MPKDRPDHRLYDQRIVERFIQRGNVKDAEYDKFLSSLPDLEEAAAPLAADADLEDDDDEA